MTQVYPFGPYDPARTPAKMAELMNSIPKLQHKFPEVPTSYTAKRKQMSEEVEEAILEASEKSNIPVAMRYCRSCFSFSRDLSLFSIEQQSHSKKPGEYIYWKANLRGLASAAERQCSFCAFIACRFFNDTGLIWAWSTDIEQPKPPLGCCALCEDEVPKVKEAIDRLRSLEEKYPDAFFGFIIQPTDFSLELQSYTKLRFLAATSNTGEAGVKEILGFRRDLVIEIYSHPGTATTLPNSPNAIKNILLGDPELCFPLNPPDNFEPGDEGTYAWAGHHLQKCVSSHDDCPKPVRGDLPTRVVKIIDAENLKPVSESQKAHYVALSYCGGGPQTFATTTQTLKIMREGFKASSLPQTLQDAVKVTQNLGIDYLWIDSLCIIQDSDEDKFNELPNMGLYYGNAYFTLIAATAKCTDGFLSPKKACEKHANSTSFRNMLSRPFLCGKGDTHFCLFREETPYDLSKEPVSKRAWTFQERVLSPRVLMYGQRVLWQCKSLYVSDGGCDDWTQQPWNIELRRIQSLLGGATTDADSNTSTDETLHSHDATAAASGIYDTWYPAVREFSRRSLSFEDDKLPAISALATKLQNISGDEYLAGLWRNDMLRGLLWSTYPTVTLVKPPTWRAPSWSWASVNNPIDYRRLPGPSAIALAEIVKCSITPKHPTAPHGEIKDTIMEISGLIMTPDKAFTKTIMKQDNRITHDNMTTVMMDMALFKEDEANAGFVKWEAPEKHILLLLYATMRNGSNWDDENGTATVADLVLGEIEEGKYERFGCFTTIGMQGMKYLTHHLSKKTVRLV
ncbi:hypothetical protein ACMFMF_001926 [Clarireedia jacksonii]